MLTTTVAQPEYADSEWPRRLKLGDKTGLYSMVRDGSLIVHAGAFSSVALVAFKGGAPPRIISLDEIGPVTPCPPGTSITITQEADHRADARAAGQSDGGGSDA